MHIFNEVIGVLIFCIINKGIVCLSIAVKVASDWRVRKLGSVMIELLSGEEIEEIEREKEEEKEE